MKAFLTAVCAVVALGVAQAASLNWDNIEGGVSLGTKTAPGATDVSLGDGKWTVACVASFPASGVSGFTKPNLFPAILGVSPGTSTEAGAYRFYTTNGGKISLGGPNQSKTGDFTIQGGATVEFAISYNGTDTLTYYINGTAIGTSAFSGDITKIVWGQMDYNKTTQNLFSSENDPTLDLNYVVGLDYAEAAALSIPEPTALALLALGVAGLALRRRAA